MRVFVTQIKQIALRLRFFNFFYFIYLFFFVCCVFINQIFADDLLAEKEKNKLLADEMEATLHDIQNM